MLTLALHCDAFHRLETERSDCLSSSLVQWPKLDKIVEID